MTLTQRITELAAAIGQALKSRVSADHPGLARAWVCFGDDGTQVVIHAAHHVQGVTRLAAGQYRVTFAQPLPDTLYAWQAFARTPANQQAPVYAAARESSEAKTIDWVEVICATPSGTLLDTPELTLTVFR